MPNCRPRAHPRACGENAVVREFGEAARGSSPRVRGKPTETLTSLPATGLIPARAGKTHWIHQTAICGAAHPRACGENLLPRLAVVGHVGSSPRVRGKQAVQALGGEPGGLIPARAGKTTSPTAASTSAWAHPRACGENSTASATSRCWSGSSPRVRGKRGDQGPPAGGGGLIPARAGKTGSRSQACGPAPAHPRACGENSASDPPWLGSTGSSPRVRGKLGERPTVVGLDGLIPARAGKTPDSNRPARDQPAHPRACGENATSRRHARTAGGSSPRVRGKRPRGIPHRHPRGLIPARAGKTAPTRRRSNGSRAHPRACGENIGPGRSRRRARSSSPRVRGKRASSDRVRQPVGLIPARAGKTTVWSL